MGKAKSEDHCSDQNGANTLPVGVAHTYIAYIREYPPGHPAPLFVHLDVIYIYFWQFSVFLQNILPFHADTLSRQARHATEKLRKYDQ